MHFLDIISYYEELVSISTLGLLNKKINEVKLLLQKEELANLDYEKYNWLEILYVEVMRLYLLVVRQGKAFEDIDII